MGKKCRGRRTAVLAAAAMKFACSVHRANIILTSCCRIGTTVSDYLPSTSSGNKTSPFSRAGRGGGGDNANDLETDPTVIDEM